MKKIFADASYWVATINPKDQLHQKAKAVSQSLGQVQLIVTHEVLSEVLTFFAEYGSMLRQKATEVVQSILANSRIVVVEQSKETFMSGLRFYEQRLDKGYSLTDCASMVTMRRLKITEVLTNDHHFEQEGFTILLKP